ncbi:glycosyltransferase family 4 protein [Clostridium perfringens]|uniref:glycosyltransferase family 4 protein n=1 Tax=Clostridium perfringens TaxID=1502 RepID=UPI0018E45ED7|nr:glycosyltransferase family 4 protein [Clostridium perfringens]MBI6060427.1 glycosyltransferase family 4 protein [Clostridium perfringens]
MKKYKVLIVHNYYKVPGGEDTVVENEKNLLIDNNHEVVMYIRHNNEINGKNFIGKLLLPIESIFSIKTYMEIKKIIKNENIDIVHVHNTLPLISPSVYYAARSCKVPIVQTIHNFRFLCPGATFTRDNKICEECVTKGLKCSVKNKCYRKSRIQTFISAFNLWFNRRIGTYKKIDAYIALTDFNKNKMSYLIDINKIYVKPNFMKSVNYEDNNECRKYFIFIGRIDKLKGIDILLKAWHEINDKLIIIGKGPDEHYLNNYIKKDKSNNIEYLGFKEKKDVLELLKKSKALIVPSQWYEGFPMTIVESFSLGIPVIAGDIGNLSVIIENNVNGCLFKYNDYLKLREVINKIKDDSRILRYLSNNAKKEFCLKYNEKSNYNILMNIYKDVLGEKYEK